MTTTDKGVRVVSSLLSPASSVQELLRAMYLYSTDHILAECGDAGLLLHKDQLVSLLERSSGELTLRELPAAELKEPLSARTQMEDMPQDTPLLLFAQNKLSLITFGEYRGRRIKEPKGRLPEWWGIPLPLLCIRDGAVSLNDAALPLIPGGAKSLADQIDTLRKERIITLPEKKQDRTFTLSPLSDEVFFLEDISGDFEMAEELVWWAAIGRTLVRRMEANGLVVRRLSPSEDEPGNAEEIIHCSWEGEPVGKLSIELSAETPSDNPEPDVKGKALAVSEGDIQAKGKKEVKRKTPRKRKPSVSAQARKL